MVLSRAHRREARDPAALSRRLARDPWTWQDASATRSDRRLRRARSVHGGTAWIARHHVRARERSRGRRTRAEGLGALLRAEREELRTPQEGLCRPQSPEGQGA